MSNKKKIRQLIRYEQSENWQKAIEITKSLLKESPDDHWLLTRLASSYYELRQYRRALSIDKKALRIAPNCPLVLWGYAGSLDMLGNEKQAIPIWKSLLRKGVKRIAYGECGEGIRHTKSLLNDCRYRIGNSYARLGKKQLAKKFLLEHLTLRQRGIPSLYSRTEVIKKLQTL